MKRRGQNRNLAPIGVAVLQLVLAAGANAQEFCVACSEPNAVYRCVVDHAGPSGMPLKMLCISRMAQEGGHQSCSVKGGTVFDCNGPVRRIDARAASPAIQPAPTDTASPKSAVGPASPAKATLPEAAPATTTQGGSPPTQQVVPPTAAKGPPPPPKTVAEMAKEMGKSSGEAFEKAGEASKKAWECMTSLFTRCK